MQTDIAILAELPAQGFERLFRQGLLRGLRFCPCNFHRAPLWRTGQSDGLIPFDEPRDGLAPARRLQVVQFLRSLRARGISVLLIEQKLVMALELADRCLVMGHGRIVFEGSASALRAEAGVRREWLEV